MFRKSLVFLLGASMVLSLAGCGGSSGGGEDTSKDYVQETKSDGDKKVISFYSWSEMAEQDFDKAETVEKAPAPEPQRNKRQQHADKKVVPAGFDFAAAFPESVDNLPVAHVQNIKVPY